MNCHMCGNETDYVCRDCGEPVCEECCVPYTLQNQIDYTLCTCCYEGAQASAQLHHWKEQDAKEKREKEFAEARAVRNAAARKRYRLPENVEKRLERRRELMELRRKQTMAALRTIARIFGGSDA